MEPATDIVSREPLGPRRRPVVALVLTGGGARSAYQVGVLRALAEILPRARNPFQIIVGTSAGAVAASVLAAEAHVWREGVAGLLRVWSNFRTGQVFHVDAPHVVRSGLHWALSLISGGLILSPPKSLLETGPLKALLAREIDCSGIRRSIARGHLRACALCATSYATGQSVAFFDGVPELSEWTRAQHMGRRSELSQETIRASIAIPLLFTPVKLGAEYFGDGSMRQLNPLSPAVQLGADRLLILGVRSPHGSGVDGARRAAMPSPGEVLGFMLDTLFTDQIYGDLEHIDRMNQLVRAAPQARGLRAIETLMIAPSVDPSEIAARHAADIPSGLRALLRVLGGRPEVPGHQLTSYLAFEAPYTRALIELGYQDAIRARTTLRAFVAGERLQPATGTPGMTQLT
ncbi:MAG: patatin-like phospholipase family protein [Steroidobacteraceae bacterium]